MNQQRLGRISRLLKAGPYRPGYVMGPKDKRLAAETVQRMPSEMTLKDAYLQVLSKHYASGGSAAESPKHLSAIKPGSKPSFEQFLYWARKLPARRLP
jgi:hypothetical protein